MTFQADSLIKDDLQEKDQMLLTNRIEKGHFTNSKIDQ